MKVWITKLALNPKFGIHQVEGTRTDYGFRYKDKRYVYGGYASGKDPGKQWHTSFESAAKRAEEMRLKRIKTLQKEIARLEALTFAQPAEDQ